MPRIHRALISVSDKRGLPEFATALAAMGVEIISTGGTYASLIEQGIPARAVSDITGFPEILNGRVKTLHPKIHGALLALGNNAQHLNQLKDHDIEPIDMLVVNLYPFESTIAVNGTTLEQAVEQIDVGGPAMIRAAAKNFKHKAVLVSPESYDSVLAEMQANGKTVSEATCFALAVEAFTRTAEYDAAISQYLSHAVDAPETLPRTFHLSMRKELDLRYGENPHQRAALYGRFTSLLQKLHGKELSYNNITDITASVMLVAEFDEPTVAIIKHTNPCGVGTGATVAEAYEKALATDPKSAFGGIVVMNHPPDVEAAEKLNRIFTEVIIAPDYTAEVLALLKNKKDRRIIRISGRPKALTGVEVKSVPEGILVQEPDSERTDPKSFRVVTRRTPSSEEMESMLYAWRVAKHVKSNAIVYAKRDRTLGIGAGQMSRFDSARLAAWKASEAGLPLTGSAVASDAFFPFADGLLEAVKVGATAVIEPGGSIRDEEIIKAADAHNLAMVFTGIRHFRH